MLTNGPFLEFRLSVHHGQNYQAANGGRVGRKLLSRKQPGGSKNLSRVVSERRYPGDFLSRVNTAKYRSLWDRNRAPGKLLSLIAGLLVLSNIFLVPCQR